MLGLLSSHSDYLGDKRESQHVASVFKGLKNKCYNCHPTAVGIIVSLLGSISELRTATTRSLLCVHHVNAILLTLPWDLFLNNVIYNETWKPIQQVLGGVWKHMHHWKSKGPRQPQNNNLSCQAIYLLQNTTKCIEMRSKLRKRVFTKCPNSLTKGIPFSFCFAGSLSIELSKNLVREP